MDVALHNALKDQVSSLLKEERLMLALENQINAFSREPGGIEYMLQAQQLVEGMRKAVDKRKRHLFKLSKTDPAFVWAKETLGLGPAILLVLGRMPNLQEFPNPSKVWKWCGLHVTKDGTAARMRKGMKAEDFGFSPFMRALTIARVGDAMMKSRGVYRVIYDETKERAEVLHPEWIPIRRHRHAIRVMVKRILLDAWCVDRGIEPWCEGALSTTEHPGMFEPLTLTAV